MDKSTIAEAAAFFFACFIVWMIVDKIFGFSKKWKEEKATEERTQADTNAKGDELDAVLAKGVKLSWPKSKANDMAAGLYVAMKGIGTDTNRVFQIISNIKNDADFLAVNAAFGVRDDDNLTQWINGDLSASDIHKLNEYFVSKGIKYKF